MHLLTRKLGQSIIIFPNKGQKKGSALSSVFKLGPIEIVVEKIHSQAVQLRVDTHDQLDVVATDLPIRPEELLAGLVSEQSGAILAKNVFDYRIARQLSLRALSEITEIPFYTLCAIERGLGVISLDELDSLSQALDIDVTDLLVQEE